MSGCYSQANVSTLGFLAVLVATGFVLSACSPGDLGRPSSDPDRPEMLPSSNQSRTSAEREGQRPSDTPIEESPAPRIEVSSHGASVDRDFPDPTIIRAGNFYYAYATQTETDSGFINIQLARSKDLEEWIYLGEALPEKPDWALDNQAYWAPHVVARKSMFYLYYSAVPDDPSEGENCLAVATADSPEGPFEDVGEPMFCSYEIDPMVYRDPEREKWFMYWGSGGNIAVQRMSNDLLRLRGERRTLLLGWSAPKKLPYEHGIEGPFIIRRNGWYFLFYSGDLCCEYPPHYALLVARSRDPNRGFARIGEVEDRKDSTILTDWGRWKGPGHCSVVRSQAGTDWVACHAIDEQHRYIDGPGSGVRRVMLVRRLLIRGGWPYIRRDSEGA
jgi:arabinan endo-1,5-alpha-L-arabinosidase